MPELKHYQHILITGGAGFIGSSLAVYLKKSLPKTKVTCLDNLSRTNSRLNLPRLKKANIRFIKKDIRFWSHLKNLTPDLIIEAAAEPSVLSQSQYLIDTNLKGALNCFRLASQTHAGLIFLSTSRVYPIDKLNRTKTPVNETFPLSGHRSLYGATKLASEFMLLEYSRRYSFNCLINRLGLVAGPYQDGQSNQGLITYWLKAHYLNKPLTIYNYQGKQVRDVLHIDDLCRAVKLQIQLLPHLNQQIINLGGGVKNTVSLKQLTKLCRQITGHQVPVTISTKPRLNDIKQYITNNSKARKLLNWQPRLSVKQTLQHTYLWLTQSRYSANPLNKK